MDKITKPCLKYYMKTCPAPCKYKDIEDEYSTNVKNFKNFLKGHSDKVIEMLESRMKSLVMKWNLSVQLVNVKS